MTDRAANNKLIAKNTLILYGRTLLTMFISLFTSRVVLNSLGVVDYGVSSVVGGCVGMFSFITSSMSGSISRYLVFEVGHGDKEKLRTIFSTAINIQIGMAVLIVFLSETIGLWFLNTQLNIPEDRMGAANWVLQFSIISTAVGLTTAPYGACIIAHEKMSIYAYFSIFDVIFKLIIVYLLYISPFDKLITYSVLGFVVAMIMRAINVAYCKRNFEECHYRYVMDKPLIKEMSSFAGWSMFGDLSATMFGTGLNMLLNIYFGPAVNAARGVALQVQGAIQTFVGNFQTALNPQITKTFARGELDYMHSLMFRSARFSFFLLFFLALPVLMESEFILKVWLKTVPEDTVIFMRIIICTSLIYTMANPLITASKAEGHVKTYQMVCGGLLLLILPISWVLLALGCPAWSVFVVHFVMEAVTQIARMIMLKPRIGLKVRDYFTNIYSKVVAVVLVATVAPLVLRLVMPYGVARFFVVCIVCVVSNGAAIYFLGLTHNERALFRLKAQDYLNKIFHRRS